VNGYSLYTKIILTTCLTCWGLVIFLPLACLVFQSFSSPSNVPCDYATTELSSLTIRSFTLAAVIAFMSILSGYFPGRLLGTSHQHSHWLLPAILIPLALPRYVLYYAWTLLLSPTSALGTIISGNPDIARFLNSFTSTAVLVFWYWPIAALLVSQGWRHIDHQIWENASLDAKPLSIFKKITLPLLIRPILMAFAVCFVLSLSEFATFHLGGIQTIGTELAVLYELTGSEHYVARAAWPLTLIALTVSLILLKTSRRWLLSATTSSLTSPTERLSRHLGINHNKVPWTVFILLMGLTLFVPLALLLTNINTTTEFHRFFTLHYDDLGWSLITAVLAAGLALLIVMGALTVNNKSLSMLIQLTIFLTMFIPASLVAVSLLKILAVLNLPTAIRQGWYLVSFGQAARFTGLALILLQAARSLREKQLSESAALDGASPIKIWWFIHWPRIWPIWLGSFLLIAMFSFTELSATMVLLPAGLPNFAQRLLNQMHYARDQQVITSCLILIALFIVFITVIILLLRSLRVRYVTIILCITVGFFSGCDLESRPADCPKVLHTFGRTGRGPGEFIYPRAIDIGPDENLYIVDKTGRIQNITTRGKTLSVIHMPDIEAGKPVGISIAPDGNLYVADTHYNRILIYSPSGKIIDKIYQFGPDDKDTFIYPTDIAFTGEKKNLRIFVSEYGGRDRITVFDSRKKFLFAFGSPGNAENQFSRPSALCVDQKRKRLYIADACNHRIAVYNFKGELNKYIGSVGREAGQLRYPYDLALLPNGNLVVCEFGNNRIQLFQPDGRSLAVYGRPGRQSGELAYPWALTIDNQERVYIVDAGNNRIQIWQL